MYICKKKQVQPYSEKATYVEGVAKKFLKGELQSCVCVCVCVCVCLCMSVCVCYKGYMWHIGALCKCKIDCI